MFPKLVTNRVLVFPKLVKGRALVVSEFVTDRRPCVTRTCNGPFLGEMLPRHSRHSIGREKMQS